MMGAGLQEHVSVGVQEVGRGCGQAQAVLNCLEGPTEEAWAGAGKAQSWRRRSCCSLVARWPCSLPRALEAFSTGLLAPVCLDPERRMDATVRALEALTDL